MMAQVQAELPELNLVAVQGSAARDATFSIVKVTPEMAVEYLKRKRSTAARVNSAVSSYAQAMKAGEWVLNGMPIIFARNHDLLDGVQRLYACVEANTPFVTVVAENVDEDTLHTIDQQRRRSFAGVLQIRGVSHASSVAGMLSKLIRYDDGTLTKGNSAPPWSRMERALDANRDDIDSAVKFSFDHAARILSESVRTPLAFMGQRVDRVAIRRLFDSLVHPDRFEADEPGVMIRRRILEAKADKAHRLSATTLFALCIKALNDTVSETRRDAYTWSDIVKNPRTGEEFPVLEGYSGLKDPVNTDARPETEARLQALAEEALRDPKAIPMTVETITPEVAERYLAANMRNRNIVQNHVKALARDIINGRWMFNAQPICFSRSGRLLNGQHRLMSVIEAQQPIEVLVLRGLPEEAFETYDKHAKRAPSIEGSFEDFGDKALLAAAAVLLWKRDLRPDGEPKAHPTTGEVRDTIRSHPALLDYRHFARKMVRYGRSSALLYAAYKIMQEDPNLGKIFLERFETGANLPAGHVILRLRDRLIDIRGKTSQESQIDEVMTAWAKFQKKPNVSAIAA